MPTDPEVLGHQGPRRHAQHLARLCGKPSRLEAGIAFDRRLYVVCHVFEQSARIPTCAAFPAVPLYIRACSWSRSCACSIFDLQDPDYKSAIGMVHSRFSTNTAQLESCPPQPFILHNGEINTIRGNVDTMLAREETIGSNYRENDMTKVLPSSTPRAIPTRPSWITRWSSWS